jgi:4-methylaminobutanoate oxidase (formaldehyde-forming)
LLLLCTSADAAGLESKLANLDPSETIIRTDVTSAYAELGLVGPRVEDLLCRVTALDVSPAALPDGSCAETRLAGAHALLVRPPGALLPTMLLYVSWDLGEYVWKELLRVGGNLGLKPVGLDAWRRLVRREGPGGAS